jgi:hypothetical protein
MNGAKRLPQIIAIGAIAFVIGYWFVKTTFFVRPWRPPMQAIAYSWETEHGQKMSILFSKNHNVLMWYEDRSKGFEDAVLTGVAGSAGTNLIGRLWYMRGSQGWTEHKFVPSGTRPLFAEISIISRNSTDGKNHFFPSVGTTEYHYFFFGDGFLLFQNRHLKEISVDESKIIELIQRLVPETGLKPQGTPQDIPRP